jgi:hypothetical protein
MKSPSFGKSYSTKGGFLLESVNPFSYLPKNIPNFYPEFENVSL